MARRTLILGGPGTGKTEFNLRRIESIYAKDYALSDIAYVTFTRNARLEARKRLREKLGADASDLRHFRTMHSMCFHLLELKRDENVTTARHRAEYCRLAGVQYKKEEDREFSLEDFEIGLLDTYGVTEGNTYFRFYQWLTATQATWVRRMDASGVTRLFAEFCTRNNILTSSFFGDAYEFLLGWERYKEQRNIYDYNDFLLEVLDQKLMLPTKVLIVDEAQDLSSLQLAVFELWAKGQEVVDVSGDDDQGVHEWAGANTTYFNSHHQGYQELILRKSHRLPMRVAEWALKFISRNRNRLQKEFEGTERPGEIRSLMLGDVLRLVREFSERQESVFIQFRSNNQRDRFARQYLLRSGIPFTYQKQRGAFYTEKLRTVNNALHCLYNGRAVSGTDLAKLIEFLPASPFFIRGFKSKFKRRDGTLQYSVDDIRGLGVTGSFLRLLGDGPEAMIRAFNPKAVNGTQKQILIVAGARRYIEGVRVFVDTMHAFKGSTADHNFVCLDLPKVCSIGYRIDPEEQRRVLYTGFTRGRNNLYLFSGVFPNADSLTVEDDLPQFWGDA